MCGLLRLPGMNLDAPLFGWALCLPEVRTVNDHSGPEAEPDYAYLGGRGPGELGGLKKKADRALCAIEDDKLGVSVQWWHSATF